MKVFAIHNSNPTVREESSSGGVFSMLAEKILSCRGTVYGATFNEDWRVVHKRIDNVENLGCLRGSKYVFSDVSKVYSCVLDDLKASRLVLFSGTPCQVAAMRKRAGENDNLLLVEVVCHGAPKPRLWEQYLKEQCRELGYLPQDILAISFRDKRTGWRSYSFTIKFKDGNELTQLYWHNPYMRAFINDYILREACFKCPFKYPYGSAADITLGDFWGIEKITPELDNDEGMSLVIARTENGNKSVESIYKLDTYTLQEVAKYNPSILYHTVKPKQYKRINRELQSNSFLDVVKKYPKPSAIYRIKRCILKIFELIRDW